MFINLSTRLELSCYNGWFLLDYDYRWDKGVVENDFGKDLIFLCNAILRQRGGKARLCF